MAGRPEGQLAAGPELPHHGFGDERCCLRCIHSQMLLRGDLEERLEGLSLSGD
jgi:hypothetical protein